MKQDFVSVRGKKHRVIRRLHLGGNLLLAVAQLKTHGREAYKVFDASTRQWRALHLLPSSPDAARHLRILQRVTQGDNEIVQILQICQHKNHTLVLLPWIDGFNLAEILNRQRNSVRRIGLAEAVRLLKGVAHALRHLHHRNHVVHGDVKPSNLILTRRTSLVLIDYGSAWRVERTTQRDEGDGFSPGYSAPELVRGSASADWRADHFSIGVILYEMLTGRLPYGGLGGLVGTLPARLLEQSELLYPSKLSPESSKYSKRIWNKVDELTVRALSIDPNSRFPTQSDWLDAWASTLSEIRRTKELVHNGRSSLRRIPLYLRELLFRR